MFSPVFPAGPLFSCINNIVVLNGEMNLMTKYWRRNEPKGCLDIGLWIDFLEMLSFVSIFVSTGIVVFTSSQETLSEWFGETPYQNLLVLVLIVEHMLIAFKFFVAGLIEDVPHWVVEQKRYMGNRVNQEKTEIQKELTTRKLVIADKQEQIAFVEEIMRQQHSDRDLASLLLPKLL